jgi:hypothetical protein
MVATLIEYILIAFCWLIVLIPASAPLLIWFVCVSEVREENEKWAQERHRERWGEDDAY